MERKYSVFLLLSFLIVFKPGEHLGGPVGLLYVLSLAQDWNTFSVILETTGLIGLGLSIYFGNRRHVEKLVLVSLVVLWLSLADYLVYYFDAFDFIGGGYLLFLTLLPFVVATSLCIKKAFLTLKRS